MSIIIFGDNQGAIALARNPQFHFRIKHIATQHHFICKKQAKEKVDFQYILTE